MPFLFFFNEESYEESIIELMQIYRYNYYSGYDIERDYTNPLFMQDLENLYNINHDANREAVKKAIQKIQNIDTGSLEEKNDKFMDYL